MVPKSAAGARVQYRFVAVGGGAIASILPATARADVVPGPIEFSMLGFFWAVVAFVLAGVIYVIGRLVRSNAQKNDSASELQPPRWWQTPLFRKAIRAACVAAFLGFIVTSCLMLRPNSRARNDDERERYIEQQRLVRPVSSP
ncbi:MAG TPA: hypothetical protein PK156_33205 [Polyangium sp.]|nr:hypothetical protein [Polyangium sp.]